MRKILFLIVLIVTASSLKSQTLLSPDKNFKLIFTLSESGQPTYELNYKNKTILKPSSLGIELQNDKNSLLTNFSIADK